MNGISISSINPNGKPFANLSSLLEEENAKLAAKITPNYMYITHNIYKVEKLGSTYQMI